LKIEDAKSRPLKAGSPPGGAVGLMSSRKVKQMAKPKNTTPTDDGRQRDLAKIHSAKKQLGNDEKTPGAGDHIQLADLSAEARQVAEAIGLRGLMALAAVMGGGWVYIPHPKRLAAGARNRRISAEFNGGNLRELATRHGLSVRRIRGIVAQGAAGRQPKTR
jgi:hypothetical protein